MGAIDGLTEADEKLLLAAIKQLTPSGAAGRRVSVFSGTETGGDPFNAADMSQQIDEIIMSHKFDDPNLERIRRIAAKEWPEMKPQVDRTMARFLGFGDDE